jgi:hypothetical protein
MRGAIQVGRKRLAATVGDFEITLLHGSPPERGNGRGIVTAAELPGVIAAAPRRPDERSPDASGA